MNRFCACFAMVLSLVFVGSLFANDDGFLEIDKTSNETLYSVDKAISESEKDDFDENGKVKKVIKKSGKQITKITDTAGNVVLEGVDKIGKVISKGTGERFQTKWKMQDEEDPAFGS